MLRVAGSVETVWHAILDHAELPTRMLAEAINKLSGVR
jgi:hypothetical protein